ncbi:MAG: helix-turn-helix transcriptional regulator [Candidatus Pacearchaeota archaeon]
MLKVKGLILAGMLLVMTILAVSHVQAATIHGRIYGPGLEMLQKAIVAINSTPRQNLVAAEGIYSFIVPQGTYEIEAFYTSHGSLLYTKETITVPQEGSFTLDLILFETQNIEDINFDETELKMIEDLLKEREKTNWDLVLGIIAILIVVAVAIYLFLKTKRKTKPARKPRKHKGFRARSAKSKFEEEKPTGDETLAKTLEILKRERRVTQRDIRKELKLSEAKTSLIIADLEAQGKVKKIKRGRGNIIIYQE